MGNGSQTRIERNLPKVEVTFHLNYETSINVMKTCRLKNNILLEIMERFHQMYNDLINISMNIWVNKFCKRKRTFK